MLKNMKRYGGCDAVLMTIVLAVVTACTPQASAKKEPPGRGSELNEQVKEQTGSTRLVAEVWVDNWFKMYVNGAKLIEDSVSITTERSFNAERVTFSADLPATIAFEFRDFMENSTGLEYIGTGRQQMGDGGAIAQFFNAGSGEFLAATDSEWRCLVVQRAPEDTACAREQNPQIDSGVCTQSTVPVPAGWTSSSFDDKNWPRATIHSASSVRPKGGYDRVHWDRSAKIIWGPDLERDNIVLCRTRIGK